MKMKCTNCGNNVESSWKVCPFCGEKLNIKKTCSSCGKELDPSWKACPFCGESVNKQSDFSSFSSNSSFMDFEKQYKVNKEEEERIKKEKAEKERKEKEAKLAREKAAKEKAEKEARERERIASEERRKMLIAQGSIPNLSSDKKTLTFGRKENYFGKPSILEWKVLKIENGYALCYNIFSTYEPYSPRENDYSWANSNYRKWMNETLYRNYFDDEARKYIVKAKTSDGCEDYIFSLTVGDIDKYFVRRIDSDGTKFYNVSNVWLRGVINHSKYDIWYGGVKQYKGVPFISCAGLLDASERPWYKETDIYLMPAMFVKLP